MKRKNKEVAWTNIKLFIDGKEVEGIESVSYSEKYIFKKPYLVIKSDNDFYLHNDYERLQDALEACGKYALPYGDLICVYNLQDEKYETIEVAPENINPQVKNIIFYYLNEKG